VRDFLHGIFVQNIGLKLIALLVALAVFFWVRTQEDVQSALYVTLIYSSPPDKILVTDVPKRVRVSVRGPWSRVSRLNEKDVDPIRIDLGAAGSGEFTFQEDMLRLPPGLKVVSFNPASVKLVFEKRMVRQVPVVPSLEGSPAPGYRVEGTEVDPSSVAVTGAQSVVGTLTHVGTELVQVTGAKAQVSRVVGLAKLPSYAEFVDEARVRVTVRIRPEMSERVLARIPVRIVGGGPGARAEPATVDVLLRGPRPTVELLIEKDVEVEVVVGAKESAAALRGAHLRPVAVKGLPEGVTAVARPSTVRVVVGREPGEKGTRPRPAERD